MIEIDRKLICARDLKLPSISHIIGDKLINPIGFYNVFIYIYIYLLIRIPTKKKRWDDHPQYREFIDPGTWKRPAICSVEFAASQCLGHQR